MDEWLYDDCRLENNGIIRKDCGFNRSFRYNTDLKTNINMKIILWCNKNCQGRYGWFFDNTKEKPTITFQKKIDYVNFKLKYL